MEGIGFTLYFYCKMALENIWSWFGPKNLKMKWIYFEPALQDVFPLTSLLLYEAHRVFDTSPLLLPNSDHHQINLSTIDFTIT